MNPIRPCPYCGKDANFHEDELAGLEDGSVVCLECGMRMEENNMILEIVAGKHPELVDEILAREEEDEEGDDNE